MRPVTVKVHKLNKNIMHAMTFVAFPDHLVLVLVDKSKALFEALLVLIITAFKL